MSKRSEVLDDLVPRIRSIEGHLKKVEEMVNDDRIGCARILDQTYAIQRAIKSLDKEIILNHFKDCKDAKKCPNHNRMIDEIVNWLDRRKI